MIQSEWTRIKVNTKNKWGKFICGSRRAHFLLECQPEELVFSGNYWQWAEAIKLSQNFSDAVSDDGICHNVLHCTVNGCAVHWNLPWAVRVELYENLVCTTIKTFFFLLAKDISLGKKCYLYILFQLELLLHPESVGFMWSNVDCAIVYNWLFTFTGWTVEWNRHFSEQIFMTHWNTSIWVNRHSKVAF